MSGHQNVISYNEPSVEIVTGIAVSGHQNVISYNSPTYLGWLQPLCLDIKT